jgi:hypothetical protein
MVATDTLFPFIYLQYETADYKIKIVKLFWRILQHKCWVRGERGHSLENQLLMCILL